MKKVVLTFIIVLAAAYMSLAADPVRDSVKKPVKEVPKPTAPVAAANNTVHTIVNGMIKSVSWADPAKGTKSEVVVTDAATWKKINILITPTTTLWDADDKAIMRDKIISRRRVKIIYRTNDEGLNIAKSIKILK
jgi:hypothetical protein